VLLNSVYARSEQQRDAVRQRYREARTRGSSALIDAALQRWFSDTFAQASPDIVEQVRERLNNNEARGFLPAYKLFAHAEDEPAEQLRGIDVPTLVITGADDSGSTPAMSAQLARCIPRARLQVLDGAKHMLPVENARWLSDALHAFIAAQA
jgi:pimeloyl-ACP methyl ester carboxylesterase